MIRFVVMIKLKPGAREAVDFPKVWRDLADVEVPGFLAFSAGFDLGQDFEPDLERQRAERWDFVDVVDFVDFDAFRVWWVDHQAVVPFAEADIIEKTSRVVYEIKSPVVW